MQQAPIIQFTRYFTSLLLAALALFLLNNTLVHWFDWPPFLASLTASDEASEGILSSLQLALYAGILLLALVWVFKTPDRSLNDDADRLARLVTYLVRAAFWAVFLIGLVDAVISFLRIEELLTGLVGETINSQLSRPTFRGLYVHTPLLIASCVIAFFTRTLGFTWLALLVVFSEFQIVITRFIFSYEQAFMGDLVRFWYAALFLFASAYTLVEDGHVRVDVLYARFSKRGKAWVNLLGSLLLGLPLCWTIITQGMWVKGSSINSPLLSFEISQSTFGLYVKYLMAAFLLVFAVTMALQFTAYLLRSTAVLIGGDNDNSSSANEA